MNALKASSSSLAASLLQEPSEPIKEQCERTVLVFVNGIFSDALSNPAHLTDAIVFSPQPHAYTLQVLKECCVLLPIHIIFLQTEARASVQFNHHLIVENNAEVTLIEEYLSEVSHSTQVVTTVETGPGARVCFYKIQDEHAASSHTAQLNVEQHQDSYFECFTLSKGAESSQEQRKINLIARGAECRLWGLYTLTQNQQMKHDVHVNHRASNSSSNMFYKGILDKKSRATFEGKVYVSSGISHVVASQTNHNVLLSAQAEIQTEPQLEIYADDVKCTHGATVGQLDEQALFYLCSRGIGQLEAKKMLLDAFMLDVIHRIPHAAIRRYIFDRFAKHVAL